MESVVKLGCGNIENEIKIYKSVIADIKDIISSERKVAYSAANEGWSVRTLDRNISTQYYNRLMQAPQKETVINEML